MKSTWEKSENNTGVLQIEVDEKKVAAALDQAFKKVVRTVTIPGFRKGRAPRSVFEARYGVESLYQDALDILLPDAYIEALDEHGIEPIDQPDIDVEQFEKGQPLKFKAEVQLKPTVELGEYKGLEVPYVSFEVTDEMVDEELEAVRNRHAELVVLDDETAAEDGDTVVIDFEGSIDGELFEGGAATNHTLELGSNSFIPGFEEQLIGVVRGEDRDVTVTFPEDYQAEELQGKEAVFKVTVHEIKRKVLPELDDELALDVSEFETLEEYKEDLRKNLEEQKAEEKKNYIEQSVIQQAMDHASVDIPTVMIDNELKFIYDDFANRMRQQGITMDMYFQFSQTDEAGLKEQMRPDAELSVKRNLVLETIAASEEIVVNDEDLDQELERLSGMYGQTAEELKDTFEKSGMIKDVRSNLLIRKTAEWLAAQSVMQDEAQASAEAAEENSAEEPAEEATEQEETEKETNE